MVAAVAIANTASVLSAVAVIGTYAGLVQRDPLIGSFDVVTIFTILTTVQILNVPLSECLHLKRGFSLLIGSFPGFRESLPGLQDLMTN